MTHDEFNDKPARGLHSWATCRKGEPRKGARTVHVLVWIPKDAVRPGRMADYIEEHLGWVVHRHGWWSSASLDSPDELTIVGVTVRAREIRAALAAREA